MTKKCITIFCGVLLSAFLVGGVLRAQSTNSVPTAPTPAPAKEVTPAPKVDPVPPTEQPEKEAPAVAPEKTPEPPAEVTPAVEEQKEDVEKTEDQPVPTPAPENLEEKLKEQANDAAPEKASENENPPRPRLGARPPQDFLGSDGPGGRPPFGTNANPRFPRRSGGGFPADNGLGMPTAQFRGNPANPGGVMMPPPGMPGNADGNGADSTNGTNAVTNVDAPAFTTMDLKNADEIMPVGAWQLQNMPLEAFLDVYADLVGRTVIRPATLQQAQINFKMKTPLTRRELVQALEGVLMVNQITIVPSGDKFVTATPLADAAGMGAKLNEMDIKEIPESLQFMTQIVQMTNALPSEILQTIQPFAKIPNGIVAIDDSKLLVIRDYAVNVKRMMEIIKRVDVIPPDDYVFKVIPIHYGTVADINDVVGTMIGSSSGVSSSSRLGNNTGNRLGNTGSSFGNRSNMSSSRSRTSNSRSSNTSRLGSMQANMQRLGGGANTFRNRMGNIMNRASSSNQGVSLLMDEAQIVPDERSNSLIVYATKRDMEVITNVISQLDFLLPMVLIESVIVDVTLGDSLSLGVSAAQVRTNGSNFQGLGGMMNGQNTYSSAVADAPYMTNMPAGFSYFGRLNDEWEFGVNAAATKNKSTVLQRPRILTMHGVTASFFNGQQIPYASSSYYGGYTSSANVSFEYLDVGIRLEVTPFITQEGYVLMDISQDIDEFQTWIEMGNDLRAPQTVNREATAMIAVKNKESIMLGGYIRQSKAKGNSGVPFLKDIPLLGYLFRNSTSSKDRSELLVFIRPTILDDPSSVRQFTEDQSKTLPGAYMALRDYDQDTQEQMLSAEEEAKASEIQEKKDLLRFQEKMKKLDEKAAKADERLKARAEKKQLPSVVDPVYEDETIEEVKKSVGQTTIMSPTNAPVAPAEQPIVPVEAESEGK